MDPNSRIVVTGGNGFLGRHVLGELASRGYVRVSAPSSVECDLRDRDAARRAVDGPEIVIHLAARVGGIGLNLERPGELFFDNAIMGIQLMEEARLAGVQKFVTVGTVCAYPKETLTPFSEDDLWSGYPEETNAAYGLAKKMLLVQGQAYRRQYGFNAIYLLPANLYGPGDHVDPSRSHVIPALIRKFQRAMKNRDRSVDVWGTGSVTREFLHVQDAARAIVLATERYDGGAPVNLGTGREISIRELAETIADVMGYTGDIVWDRSRPDGQPRRRLDTSRAKREFGFEARIDFAEGLRRTVEWYLAAPRN
ncbi:MAG: GDP-L-fucose synthase [Nitrolancea sp.]